MRALLTLLALYGASGAAVNPKSSTLAGYVMGEENAAVKTTDAHARRFAQEAERLVQLRQLARQRLAAAGLVRGGSAASLHSLDRRRRSFLASA